MLRLREIMTRDVVTLSPENTLREAMELLARSHVSGAPVVRGATLLGVVTAMDLLAFAATAPGVPTEREDAAVGDEPEVVAIDEEAEREFNASGSWYSDLWDDAGADVSVRFASTSCPEWNVLEEHVVDEVMTRGPLVTLPPEASAELAAAVMCQHGIHRVLVTEGDRLVGLVSALDITRAAADRRFTTRTFVFEHGAPQVAPRGSLGGHLAGGAVEHG